MLILTIGGFIVIVLIDLIPLIKHRKKFAIIAFSAVFALALLYGLMNAFEADMPSIMKAWKSLIEWLGIAYKLE